jgi:DNA-binding LytR/AlgR family response regulator
MSHNINCLIIDDEPLARQLLRTYLSARPDVTIIGECANPVEAYELLLNNSIDVIFLDVQMPVLNGIDFLRSLKRPPAIIFTTAFDEYAAKAFDLDVTDYLVKPIAEKRFEQALEKLRAVLNSKHETTLSITENKSAADHVFFKAGGRLVRVNLRDILYIEALKDFSRIFIKDQSPLLIGDHLKAVENLLPHQQFMRIHRSYTISLNAITGIFGNTIEIGAIQLPVGASYKQELLDVLKIR